MNLDRYLPNIIEFPCPLTPGTRIGAEEVAVLEVVPLAATLTLAGEQRSIFAALHEKRRDGGMLTLFACLDGEQQAWAL